MEPQRRISISGSNCRPIELNIFSTYAISSSSQFVDNACWTCGFLDSHHVVLSLNEFNWTWLWAGGYGVAIDWIEYYFLDSKCCWFDLYLDFHCKLNFNLLGLNCFLLYLRLILQLSKQNGTPFPRVTNPMICHEYSNLISKLLILLISGE